MADNGYAKIYANNSYRLLFVVNAARSYIGQPIAATPHDCIGVFMQCMAMTNLAVNYAEQFGAKLIQAC